MPTHSCRISALDKRLGDGDGSDVSSDSDRDCGSNEADCKGEGCDAAALLAVLTRQLQFQFQAKWQAWGTRALV